MRVERKQRGDGRGQPLTTAMGRSLTALRLMPALWHVSTTSLTSL